MTDLDNLLATIRPLLICVLSFFCVSQAVGALGQAPSDFRKTTASTTVASTRLAGTRSNFESKLYTVHETLLQSGTTVEEYASSSGLVFAVVWQGPVLPDLNALLGHYFMTFKSEADRARASGRRGSTMSIAFDGLVVQSNGRMRNFFGHAFAPALVPAGVNINDVLK